MIMRYRVKLREEYWLTLKKESLKRGLTIYETFENISREFMKVNKNKELKEVESYKSPKYVYLKDSFKDEFHLFAIDKRITGMALADHVMNSFMKGAKK